MRILVGMSGGVDSTFAAYKLRAEGHEVAGCALVMHDYTDVCAAEASCKALGITLYIINCRKRFEETVVSSFVSEYSRGRTPNPCVVCNSEVKFDCLLDFALEQGFDAIATGHYADVRRLSLPSGERYCVCDCADGNKNQTYMLWGLSQRVLAHLVLPLSDMTKEQVREKTRELGLVSWDRSDSQEICFIPDDDHAAFIESRIGKCPEGNFVDEEGRVLGRHRGIIGYTVGQRKGLGIALGARAFISRIDPEKNEITLSFSAAESRDFTVSGVVLSGIEPPTEPTEYALTVKHRYHSPRIPARVIFYPDGRARVSLSEPARSLTSGQSAVFYLDGCLVAGGFID